MNSLTEDDYTRQLTNELLTRKECLEKSYAQLAEFWEKNHVLVIRDIIFVMENYVLYIVMEICSSTNSPS